MLFKMRQEKLKNAGSKFYSNNALHEGGERGTPPSSPLRFGAFALGQHAGMQFASLTQILGFATHFAYPTNVVRNDEG